MAKQRDPGGKITIFSIISLIGAAFGCASGFVLGNKINWPLAIILGFLGLMIGSIPGQWLGNYGIVSLVRKLNKEDAPALRARLKKEYFISHLIVMVLLAKGEPQAELAKETLELLLSDSRDVRWHGWRTLNLNFPEVADKLDGINPTGNPDNYRERIHCLMAEVDNIQFSPLHEKDSHRAS